MIKLYNILKEAKVVPVSMGHSNYEKWKPVLEPIENRLQDPIFYDEGVLYLKNAIKHAKDPSVRNTYNSLNNEDLKQYINALNFLYSKYNIKEAKVVPAGEMSNIPSSFYKAFDDIFYKILIDHIEDQANYGFKNNKDISTFLFENNNAVITEYLKKRILQSEVEILRNGEVELVDSSNIDTLSEDELLEYLNEDKEAQRIISKLFWKYYFKYLDVQEIRKECFDYVLKQLADLYNIPTINHNKFFSRYPELNKYELGVINDNIKSQIDNYFGYYDTIPYPEDMLGNDFENYLSNSLLVQDIDEAKVVPGSTNNLLPMLTSDSTEESHSIDYNNIAKNIKIFKPLIAAKLKSYSLDKDTLDRFLINYANDYIEVDHAGEAYEALHNITLQQWLDDIVTSFEYMYEEDEEMKYEPDPRYDELTIDDIR